MLTFYDKRKQKHPNTFKGLSDKVFFLCVDDPSLNVFIKVNFETLFNIRTRENEYVYVHDRDKPVQEVSVDVTITTNITL
jgi:hypothetical protein